MLIECWIDSLVPMFTITLLNSKEMCGWPNLIYQLSNFQSPGLAMDASVTYMDILYESRGQGEDNMHHLPAYSS